MSRAQPLAPRYWVLHLVALAAVGTAGWLGLWQYDAWQERRSDQARDFTRLEPTSLSEVMGPDDAFPGDKVGQPVLLTGTWVPAGTVYVSGREHDGEDGFWVVTPLEVGPDDAALLVVRGWAPSVEGTPSPPAGEAELVAWLQPTEGTGATDDDPGDDVLPQLRVADALQHVDQDLYGAYAVARDEAATNAGTAGLEPASLDQLPEVGRFTAVRNLLYALEWWVFAAFAAFVWWRFVRDEMARETTVASADEVGVEAPTGH